MFLLFTSLKTEAPLFSVTPQPRRRWWDELVAKIGALRVCVTHKHTVEESQSSEQLRCSLYFYLVCSSGVELHTHSHTKLQGEE